MVSERIQRRIERLLEQADEAISAFDWNTVRECALGVLALDRENPDARAYLEAAELRLRESDPATSTEAETVRAQATTTATPVQPDTFAGGRYTVKRFLGEGGKKRVYLAHDTTLARDVAFALIKTDGLDVEGRERITREAQAMGKLGTHPHVVSVFDMGSEGESPYLVTELMQGGDIEGLLEQAPEHRLAIPDAVSLAVQVCRGLEFAHSHGLVHRDLKPGNVWLTADGTAKIGDFGLAVSLDRSRLTRAGMMVGTVSYMPPEQAMGGEVSPRSDLYSLGAMLYEMVTGRPPFVGEESVAIITQHLNVPPVSPTWHRPECPPGLEALILRLLEKDAAKRPASAAAVLQALEALDRGPSIAESRQAGAFTDTTPAAQANDNPLYRRTFVGREHELRQLQAIFDGAVSGNGALVMVVGEPGIGKTALCEQLATYVTVRGGKALVGHCYEEGSLSLPYLPFVEALRSYVLGAAPETLRSELGSGATDVARIVSEVREKVQVDPRASGDPEDDRWRLYQSLTGFLRNASSVQPLLIVLEDLHWADRGTLDFLVHLSRNLQGARVLITGTYRDVEVDRNHPLSPAIAELRRGSSFARIPLRGLTVDEVHRMMCNLRGQDVPWGRAEAIHRQTEGNPLFIQEVLRYLVEEGLVVREGGRWVRADDGSPESGIPEGLRDVIGKRLSRLSPACNRLLAMAAVIGREFELAALQQVADVTEDDLLAALEEALRVGVIEEHSRGNAVWYRFTHAFFQQTMYEEIIAPRRIRLHGQVARALEQVHGRRLEEHAAELSEHYGYSSDPGDLQKAVRYGQMAAARASGVFAHGEAARIIERCVQVQEVLDPDDHRARYNLLLALASALVASGETLRAANEVCKEALALAGRLGERALAAEASRIALLALWTSGAAWATGTPEWDWWSEVADRSADPGTVHRVHADLALGVAGRFRDGPRRREYHRRALELAIALGEREAMFMAAYWALGPAKLVGGYEEEDLQLAEEVIRWPREGAGSTAVQAALLGCYGTFLSWGRREQGVEAHRGMEELARRSPRAELALRALLWPELAEPSLDGRLEAVVQGSARLLAIAEAHGALDAGQLAVNSQATRAYLYLGRAAEILPPQASRYGDDSPRTFRRMSDIRSTLCLVHLGRPDEAAAVLEGITDRPPAADPLPPALLTVLVEIATAAGRGGVVETLMSQLRRLPADYVCDFMRDPTCIARHMGAGAALLGHREEARAHLERALEHCRRLRSRPEAALTRLELAGLLMQHYPAEHEAALEHLDFAIAEFREMKMQPALERALKHKGLLHA